MTTTEFLEIFEKRIVEVVSTGVTKSPLSDAMLYSVEGGGKRLRPTAVFLGASVCFAENDFDVETFENILTLAEAIELIHSYSLVHDDLPSMDNDDYRRGKLAVHKKFGESTAILTGDRLLSYAMEMLLLVSSKNINFASAAKHIAFSASQMVDGQYYDLSGMKTAQEYLNMYKKKTSALFVGSFKAGAAIGGATECQLEEIESFANHLGLAFQIADDLLDNDPKSILAVISEVDARKMVVDETNHALEAAKSFAKSGMLVDFANMLLSRKK
ncbi:MAG: polyprenyl synthetase family protein [Clostridia bacterium]